MTPTPSTPMPLDQADGLRRLFAHAQVHFVPVVSNPHMAFGGVMLERLCSGFAEQGCHTLVVDAGENAPEPHEIAPLDLAECVERLSNEVSYLAARGLPIRHVDAQGSTAGFLDAVSRAAPEADVVLVHASASDLCRLFMRREAITRPRPLLLADDRPVSVTHAYAAMKLLTQRAGLLVHDLLLSAAPSSPRAERIAMQIATCADDFLGAVLRDWMQVDPASDPRSASAPALRRWVRDTLRPAGGEQVVMPVAAIEPRAYALN
ncbi:MAG: flagellar biosynthesis protein [Burkholderiaceae bacterium]|nr:flagellar biosynthesis protein [Burkholderiaceae bacterium]